jgi:hypothetical protein
MSEPSVYRSQFSPPASPQPGTFDDVVYGADAVPQSVFDHPDSRPTFGKCKQCGVDDECPMWECMQ